MAQEAGKGRSWLLLLAAGANLVFQFGFFIAVFSVYRKPPEAVMQVGTLAMVLFAVFAAVVCGSTARAYNRSRFGWGFGAFFLPYIIPFVLYGVVRAERKARDRLLARSSAEAPPKATALAHAPIPQQPLAGAVAETGMEATAEEPAPTPTAPLLAQCPNCGKKDCLPRSEAEANYLSSVKRVITDGVVALILLLGGGYIAQRAGSLAGLVFSASLFLFLLLAIAALVSFLRLRALRSVRYWACRVCGEVFSPSGDKALTPALKKRINRIRKGWVTYARATTKRCLQQLEGSDRDERRVAIEKLAEIGPQAASAASTLKRLAEKDEDATMRARSKNALASILGPSA